MGKLTEKNKLFAAEYVANGYNATDAYIEVYYKDKLETAKEQKYNISGNAAKLLKKPEMRELIQEIQKDRFEALNVSADRVGEEIASIAFGKVGKDCSEGSKLKALELLGKQIGLYTQKIDAKVEETVITVSVDEEE